MDRGTEKEMKTKLTILMLCALLFALCAFAEAQQPKKVPRIGYLSSGDSASESARSESIRLALRALGYIEGQNIAIEYRYTEGKRDKSPELATELVRLNVDVIVAAGGDSVIRPARFTTKTIPIVMVGTGSDPVEAGFVESLAHPGGNITGVTNLSGQLGGKRLELLKEALPKIGRVAFLHEPANSGTVLEVKEVLPAAARGLKLTLRSWEVRETDDFERVFAVMIKERPDALYVSWGR